MREGEDEDEDEDEGELGEMGALVSSYGFGGRTRTRTGDEAERRVRQMGAMTDSSWSIGFEVSNAWSMLSTNG